MLLDPEARVSVLLPDVNPMPSIVTKLDCIDDVPSKTRLTPRAPLSDKQFLENVIHINDKIDDERSTPVLFSWGHDVKLRLIFLLLCDDGRHHRRRNVDYIFEILKSIEKEYFHVSISYFWVQMMSMCIEKVRKRLCDHEDGKKAISSSSSFWIFRNQQKHQENVNTLGEIDSSTAATTTATEVYDMEFSTFYRQPEVQKLRNHLLYEKYYSRSVIDSGQASVEFVIPDLKQFTDVIV